MNKNLLRILFFSCCILLSYPLFSENPCLKILLEEGKSTYIGDRIDKKLQHFQDVDSGSLRVLKDLSTLNKQSLNELFINIANNILKENSDNIPEVLEILGQIGVKDRDLIDARNIRLASLRVLEGIFILAKAYETLHDHSLINPSRIHERDELLRLLDAHLTLPLLSKKSRAVFIDPETGSLNILRSMEKKYTTPEAILNLFITLVDRLDIKSKEIKSRLKMIEFTKRDFSDCARNMNMCQRIYFALFIIVREYNREAGVETPDYSVKLNTREPVISLFRTVTFVPLLTAKQREVFIDEEGGALRVIATAQQQLRTSNTTELVDIILELIKAPDDQKQKVRIIVDNVYIKTLDRIHEMHALPSSQRIYYVFNTLYRLALKNEPRAVSTESTESPNSNQNADLYTKQGMTNFLSRLALISPFTQDQIDIFRDPKNGSYGVLKNVQDSSAKFIHNFGARDLFMYLADQLPLIADSRKDLKRDLTQIPMLQEDGGNAVSKDPPAHRILLSWLTVVKAYNKFLTHRKLDPFPVDNLHTRESALNVLSSFHFVPFLTERQLEVFINSDNSSSPQAGALGFWRDTIGQHVDRVGGVHNLAVQLLDSFDILPSRKKTLSQLLIKTGLQSSDISHAGSGRNSMAAQRVYFTFFIIFREFYSTHMMLFQDAPQIFDRFYLREPASLFLDKLRFVAPLTPQTKASFKEPETGGLAVLFNIAPSLVNKSGINGLFSFILDHMEPAGDLKPIAELIERIDVRADSYSNAIRNDYEVQKIFYVLQHLAAFYYQGQERGPPLLTREGVLSFLNETFFAPLLTVEDAKFFANRRQDGGFAIIAPQLYRARASSDLSMEGRFMSFINTLPLSRERETVALNGLKKIGLDHIREYNYPHSIEAAQKLFYATHIILNVISDQRRSQGFKSTWKEGTLLHTKEGLQHAFKALGVTLSP